MPDPVEIAVDVADGLVPPELKKLNEQTKWKLWVVGVLIVTTLGLITHILLACGVFPFYAGFALAGDVTKERAVLEQKIEAIDKKVTDKIDSLATAANAQRVNTLRKDMFDTRQKQCKAPSGAVRTQLTQQISDMQLEYESLTSAKYELPACADF